VAELKTSQIIGIALHTRPYGTIAGSWHDGGRGRASGTVEQPRLQRRRPDDGVRDLRRHRSVVRATWKPTN
jgi:hypothetical protein